MLDHLLGLTPFREVAHNEYAAFVATIGNGADHGFDRDGLAVATGERGLKRNGRFGAGIQIEREKSFRDRADNLLGGPSGNGEETLVRIDDPAVAKNQQPFQRRIGKASQIGEMAIDEDRTERGQDQRRCRGQDDAGEDAPVDGSASVGRSASSVSVTPLIAVKCSEHIANTSRSAPMTMRPTR